MLKTQANVTVELQEITTLTLRAIYGYTTIRLLLMFQDYQINIIQHETRTLTYICVLYQYSITFIPTRFCTYTCLTH